MSEDLPALVAQAVPAELLPERRAAEAARVEGPLTLVAAAALSGTCRYLLIRDGRGEMFGVPAVVGSGRVRRAAAGDGCADALVAGLSTGLPAPLVAEIFHSEPARGEVPVPVDQTNDLVVVGGAAMVKWLLHPTAGDQPGAVRMRQLIGSDLVPRPWALVHLDVAGERVLVATVTAVIPDAEDGWDWAVADVRALATGASEPADALASVARLGSLVAALHLALAGNGRSHASREDAAAWHTRALADLRDADLSPATAESVRLALAPLAECSGTPLIDIHGDLHVGQVLRSRGTDDLRVIDLDGSPLLTAAESLRPQPAARDVAAMLASLDHVGRVVLHRTPDLTSEQQERVLDWIREARRRFLDDYRAALSRARRSELLDEALLRPMLVQQECREYAYARRYLSHWRYVPDAALPALLKESPMDPDLFRRSGAQARHPPPARGRVRREPRRSSAHGGLADRPARHGVIALRGQRRRGAAAQPRHRRDRRAGRQRPPPGRRCSGPW